MEKYAFSYLTWHLLFKYDKTSLQTQYILVAFNLTPTFKYLRQSSLQMQYILVATVEILLYVKSFKTSN